MQHQEDLPNPETESRETPADTRITRRRLLQGSLSAAPLLMTLASRPAYATCKQPSGFSVSGNLSRPANFTCTGSPMGKKPSEWVSTSVWPSPLSRSSSPLSIISSNSADTATMLSKLNGTSPATTVEKYVIAAYLNALSGRTPSNPTEVKKLWAGRNGGYSPVPGVIWSQAQVLAYLKHTTGEL